MSDELLPYYHRELAYLRRLGAEFAEANPKIAGRLRLGEDAVEDPHVARLLESFAFLSARIRRKLDDDFPELTESLLGVLYPHYLAPVPSMAVVEFTGQPDLMKPHVIPAGAVLESAPVEGETCRFRTASAVTLWPVEVESAKLTGRPFVAPPPPSTVKPVAALRIVLRCRSSEGTFGALAPQSLRFFLRGAFEQSAALYELLLNDAVGVAVAQAPDDPNARHLPATALQPVGLGASEGLLPAPPAAFPGYRLLTEYFAFPQKFLFVDLTGLGPAVLAGVGRSLEVYVYLRRSTHDLESQITADWLSLGCTPVVNLFRQTAEPIQLTHAQYEYRVVADARRPQTTEVYSVDKVVALSRFGEEEPYLPFFAVKHAARDALRRRFWAAARRPAGRTDGRADPGTEVYLSLLDLDLDPSMPTESVLSVETTCTNRELPGRLPFGGAEPRFTLEGGAPLERIRCLTKPTPTLRPALGRGTLWRLVSHLALNHLSIAEGPGAADALREILRLYDIRDSAETRATIDGVESVSSHPTAGRAPASRHGGICRGVEVAIELDQSKFTGGGMYLFASVLERFLGLYCTVNSFTRTVVSVKGREGVLRRWPARAGESVLV